MRYKTSAELKQEAKQLLKGHWSDAVLLSLIPLALSFVVQIILRILIKTLGEPESLSYYYETTNSFDGLVINYFSLNGVLFLIISIVLTIIISLATYGVNFAFLDWIRKPDMIPQPGKSAFQLYNKEKGLKVVLIDIMIYIFTFLWTLLLIIPGIIKSLSYSQSMYIFKDANDRNPDYNLSTTNYITESRKLMHGHKARFFYIQLSFLGWAIVAIMTFGIGLLWLIPYMNATMAAFYNDLTKEENDEPIVYDFRPNIEL